MNRIDQIKRLGRDEGILAYLVETTQLWEEGKLGVDELELRLKVVDEIQDLWDQAEAEQVNDRGSAADQAADYGLGGDDL